MRKIFAFILTFLIVISTSAPAFAEEKHKAKFKMVNVLEGILPADADEELISILKETGWTINGNKMTKRVPAKNMEIEIDGNLIKSDNTGVFEIEIPETESELTLEGTPGLEKDKYMTKEDKEELKKNFKKTIKLKKDKTVIVENRINFHEWIRSMDSPLSENGKSNAGKFEYHINGHYTALNYGDSMGGSHGKGTHCNRFNGMYGDGKYYKDTTYNGIKNFLGSDCDLSYQYSAVCNNDYTSNKYCSGSYSPSYKNGRCSNIITHARYYHKHTYKTSTGAGFGPDGF